MAKRQLYYSISISRVRIYERKWTQESSDIKVKKYFQDFWVFLLPVMSISWNYQSFLHDIIIMSALMVYSIIHKDIILSLHRYRPFHSYKGAFLHDLRSKSSVFSYKWAPCFYTHCLDSIPWRCVMPSLSFFPPLTADEINFPLNFISHRN